MNADNQGTDTHEWAGPYSIGGCKTLCTLSYLPLSALHKQTISGPSTEDVAKKLTKGVNVKVQYDDGFYQVANSASLVHIPEQFIGRKIQLFWIETNPYGLDYDTKVGSILEFRGRLHTSAQRGSKAIFAGWKIRNSSKAGSNKVMSTLPDKLTPNDCYASVVWLWDPKVGYQSDGAYGSEDFRVVRPPMLPDMTTAQVVALFDQTRREGISQQAVDITECENARESTQGRVRDQAHLKRSIDY